MAPVPDLLITLTADLAVLRADVDRARRAVEAATARLVAHRIVDEVLEEHARRGGPVGTAALAELEHRHPDRARRIRDARMLEWRALLTSRGPLNVVRVRDVSA